MGMCVLGAVIGVVGVVQTVATHLTSPAPAMVPKWEPAPEEAAALLKRVAAFNEELRKAGPPPAELLLQGAEANVLIAADPTLASFREKLFLAFEEDVLRCQMSIPLKKYAFIDLSKRHLNLDARLKVSLKQGGLIVTVDQLKFAEGELSAKISEKLRKTNLGEEMYKDAAFADHLRQLESIEITQGRLSVKSRTRPQRE